MFRSQTDEQLAARHDPKPYITQAGQRMTAETRDRFPEPLGTNFVTLDSRVEYIPSRDPLPYVSKFSGARFSVSIRPFAEATRDQEWAPRPEFARPPVNPVLTFFREEADRYGDPAHGDYMHWLEPLFSPGIKLSGRLITPGELLHARRVLTLLQAARA